MPRAMEKYTAMARRAIGDEVLAAVPASRNSANTWGNAARAVLPYTAPRTVVGPEVLALHSDRIDEHRLRLFRRRIGPVVRSLPLDQLRYERTGLAMETRLQAGAATWYIHGWYERELRDLLRSLGQADALGDLT